ncbi:hypothetical protein DLM45_06075 [Hyphomicrobium methylovorum]|uniref:DUF3147 family protein n=1 Tax=Hyphomicrobium methylovorum TaxID=84 RepID=UPI0015E7C13F|nr:DUF3147 family protein [Hyphomicrobium methylovorum]MBA2125792.1 hypothetical protein [Hyphomicrobium methylovorum]
MAFATVKVLLTALIVIAISEVAKRSTAIGGIIASLPLTSLLAIVWLYGETGDTNRIARLSLSIFWYVLPSLVLFIVLSVLLAHGMSFWPSLGLSIGATFLAYLVMSAMLARFGVSI